jgi:glycosyltransferase involved in cell wall biosynthesis
MDDVSPIEYSYIVTCLESYEVAEQQIKWLSQILPDTWELIFVDDGSNPPIKIPSVTPKNTIIIRTGDYRPWTQDIARNKAARRARGKYLLMMDIDHILLSGAVQEMEKYNGKMCQFERHCGRFVDGKPQPVWEKANPVPPNIYLILRSVFLKLGGYDESLCDGHYRATDRVFLKKFRAAHGKIDVKKGVGIYVIPSGKFHSLERK